MSMESDLRKEIRMTRLRAAILDSIKAAGIVTAGVLIPNVTGTLLRMGSRQKGGVKSALRRLETANLIRVKNGRYELTPAGDRMLARHLSPTKPRRWDEKWRIITFDIPHARKTSRERLRRALQEIGFYRLQDSVWVYPFDCEDLISLLKIDFRLGKEVQYIIADRIEYDRELKWHFSLTK